jgi:transcription termination factor Rho
MNVNELKNKNLNQLVEIGGQLDVNDASDLRKDELVDRIMQRQAERGGQQYASGSLDIVDDGYGFLRRHGLMPSADDIYVSSSQVRRFGLRAGDRVGGITRAPKDAEKYWGLLRVETVNGVDPDTARRRPHFDSLTPVHPFELINLETEPKNLSQRLVNLVNPIGKGQRALIVSPPKAGKTMLLKNIANGITENYPEILLMVALIGERPEEVTDMRRSVKGEVISSTFDEPTENHTHVAEMALEIAKRQVETGRDVVILLDSITRLARAYNLALPPSGRTLSGGIDPIALYPPKRFFGAARKLEEGGSLTIIGTCLIDTGSRMDDVIYEEFKGTGNMELALDR